MSQMCEMCLLDFIYTENQSEIQKWAQILGQVHVDGNPKKVIEMASRTNLIFPTFYFQELKFQANHLQTWDTLYDWIL